VNREFAQMRAKRSRIFFFFCKKKAAQWPLLLQQCNFSDYESDDPVKLYSSQWAEPSGEKPKYRTEVAPKATSARRTVLN
jgi:hypothetical protein